MTTHSDPRDPEKTLSPNEAADIIGVKPQTLAKWRMTNTYHLPFIKSGRRVRYLLSDIQKWLDGRKRT